MTVLNDTANIKRVGWLALGWSLFALGLAGTVLPVLPTTPFMILALGAFAKGSDRVHAWLYDHPRFGPALHKWTAHHVIPLKAKVLAIGAMSASLTVLAVQGTVHPLGVFAASALMGYGALFILSKPSHAPGE